MEDSKVYHIYAKDKCLYHCIDEDEFKSTWEELRRLVGIMKTDYTLEDLSYEVCKVNRISSVDTSN